MSTKRPVPFSFRTRTEEFDQAVVRQVGAELRAFRDEMIPPENTLNYSHGMGWRTKPTDFADHEGEFVAHTVESETSFKDIVAHRLSALGEMKAGVINEMQRQFVETMYATVNRATEKTGNIVSAKDHPSLTAAYLEMLRKVEFGVDRNGQISRPSWHVSPQMAEKIRQAFATAGPDFNAEVQRLTTEKAASALGREQERIAKFPPSDD